MPGLGNMNQEKDSETFLGFSVLREKQDTVAINEHLYPPSH